MPKSIRNIDLTLHIIGMPIISKGLPIISLAARFLKADLCVRYFQG